jgi:aspartate aminotransferase
MFEEGNELRAKHGAENVFDLTLGNPELEPPQPFVDRLRELAADPPAGMHRYMANSGYPWVRARIAEVIAEETGVPVEGRHVIMTVGAACALNIALKSLLDEGDEVIVLAPYFVEYLFYIDNHGGKTTVVQTDESFQPDLAAIEAAITPKTKVIILNSPNNPTGVVYPQKLLEDLAGLLERAGERIGHPIYVITDEPYRKIVYQEESSCSLAAFRNCIFATSHSKDLALPGARIGYAVVHPEADDAAEIVGAMTFAIRTLGFVNAPSLMQHAVAEMQNVSVDVEVYRRKRDMLYRGMMDAGYECIEPGGAFYMFPRCPVDDDVEFVRRLQKERILVVPGSGFGRTGYFRVAYCMREQVIEKALPGLARVAASYR